MKECLIAVVLTADGASLVKRYREIAAALAEWAEENIPDGLTVFGLSTSHRHLLRTTNGLERIRDGIKHRTRVARLFLNESSLLRLVSAVLSYQ